MSKKRKKLPGTKLFSRINYQVQRGMSEIVTMHALSDADWTIIKDYFNKSCAFCGCEDTGNSRTGIIPDHLIPASKHGDFVLGNVVPACHDCNDKRGNKEWREWLSQNYFNDSAARIKQIEKYLQDYPYLPATPETRLSQDELNEYKSILGDWSIFLKRAKTLKSKVNDRLNLEKDLKN